MRKRRSGVLAVAVVAALSCTGCVRTGEDAARHRARKLALEDAEQVAEEVERFQFPQGGGDPGTPGYRPAWTNAGMVERIVSEYSGPNAGPPMASFDASSSRASPGPAFSALSRS
jgi:hypothetical protein